MIHYSCDRCNKSINAREEIRYVVRIEVQLAVGERESGELDDVSLEELEQMLGEFEDGVDEGLDEAASEKTFDLCSRCYSQYIENPLAIETMGIGFSKN
jgi:adenine-specific DNA methylase